MARIALVIACALVAGPGAAADAPKTSASAGAASDIRVLVIHDMETTLASPIPGRILSVNASLGSTVSSGKVLVQFYCDEQAARVSMAEAEMVGARETHEAKLRLQGLNSAGEVEVSLAAAALEKSRAQLELFRTQSAQCVVTAPFAGRAVKIHVKAYQGVNAGQPLLELVSSGAPRLRLNVPSKWLAWIRTGAHFEVDIDETGRSYAARVSAINGRVDAASQSIEIEARIDKADANLLAGMSGVARFKPPQ